MLGYTTWRWIAFFFVLLVDIHELGVYDVVFLAWFALLGLAGSSVTRRSGSCSRARLRSCFVHGFGQLVTGLGQTISCGVQLLSVALAHGFLGFFDGRFDLARFGITDFRAMLLQRFLDVVNHRVGAVAGFNLIPLLAIVRGMGLCVLGHLVDFVLRKTGRRGDGDFLFVVGGAVLRRDVENAVGVDVEGHFDLRNAARRRRNAHQLKNAQQAVVPRERALALVNLDFDRSL